MIKKQKSLKIKETIWHHGRRENMVIRNERWACKHELPFRKSSANNLLNVNFEEKIRTLEMET